MDATPQAAAVAAGGHGATAAAVTPQDDDDTADRADVVDQEYVKPFAEAPATHAPSARIAAGEGGPAPSPDQKPWGWEVPMESEESTDVGKETGAGASQEQEFTGECNLAFHPEDLVEYLSLTKAMWIAARVTGFVTEEAGEADSEIHGGNRQPGQRAKYNIVIIATGQPRFGVPLEQMRIPIRAGNSVDVFMRQDKGSAWVPAHLASDTTHAVVGAAVEVEGNGDDSKPSTMNVHTLRVRHRFDQEQTVEVYSGLAHGWQLATVEAPEDDNDSERMAIEGMQKMDKTLSWSQATRIAGETFGKMKAEVSISMKCEASPDGSGWTLWHAIPIKFVWPLSDGLPDTVLRVPAFLVRPLEEVAV